MPRAISTSGVSVHALEIRINLEGKSLEEQVQAMLDLFKVKLTMMGRVYDVPDVDTLTDD